MSQYEANQGAPHSVVSVAQFSQVASGHSAVGGGGVSTHGFVALPPAPPVVLPPPLTPPVFATPPLPGVPLDPATMAPAPLVLLDAPPRGALPAELKLPAVGPETEPAVAPPLEPVPGGSSDDVSGEHPPAASRAADQREAPPQRMERRAREWKAGAVTR